MHMGILSARVHSTVPRYSHYHVRGSIARSLDILSHSLSQVLTMLKRTMQQQLLAKSPKLQQQYGSGRKVTGNIDSPTLPSFVGRACLIVMQCGSMHIRDTPSLSLSLSRCHSTSLVMQ